MASKKTASGALQDGIEKMHYDIPKRIMSFTFRNGTVQTFHGVPADVFYGMPSGTNLRNFIELKLNGRYECHLTEAPPLMVVSTINRELTVLHKDTTFVYKLEADEIMSLPEDRYDAWEWFKTKFIVANRKPSRIYDNHVQTDTIKAKEDNGVPDV